MFPPRVVGIIGNLGQMATHIVFPLFKEAGYAVIGSDLKNPYGLTNKQVVDRADVVYFSILPIQDVASAIRKLIPYARKDTLWLHGTSIQNPEKKPIIPVLLDKRLVEREVNVGFLHFMVGPNVQSLRGQSIVYGFLPTLAHNHWKEWLVQLLNKQRPCLLEITPKAHDSLTAITQVIPQLFALSVGSVWAKIGGVLPNALRVAGPPCWLQTYGILRNLSQGEVIANILANHPYTGRIIEEAIGALQHIQSAWRQKSVYELKEIAAKGLGAISEVELKMVEEATSWHIRLEGDIRSGAVCFRFSPNENRVGLLTSVLAIFDSYGLEKTSCMAQKLPGGGCQFYIGLEDIDNPSVAVATERVIRELGGNYGGS